MRGGQADLFACQLDSLLTVRHAGSTVSLQELPAVARTCRDLRIAPYLTVIRPVSYT